MIVKHLELKNQSYRNIKIEGIQIKAFVNGNGANGSQSLDFSKSNIKLILNRDGRPHVIAQDNLKILGLASSLDTLNQSAFATTVPDNINLQFGQSGLVSFTIPFGGLINLKGNDELYIEVQNTDGLFIGNSLEASSFLEVKPIKAYGIERFVPKIRTYVIQQNETSNQYMIGDNLIRLAILNYDKTDFTQPVVQNLAFTSDRLDETYTFADLVARKLSRYGMQMIPYNNPDLALGFQQDQSFMITDFHKEYDGVMLDIQFRGENVQASKNYIVAWTYDTDWTTVQEAHEYEKKYAAATADKLNKAAAGK